MKSKKFIEKIFITCLFIFLCRGVYSAEIEWLDHEKVLVIQNKEFKKEKRFGIDVGMINSSSSPYQDSIGQQITLSYFVKEYFSVDLNYINYTNSDNDDLGNLFDLNNTIPLLRKVNSGILFHVNWIPIYGKLNIFNRTMFMDVGLGISYGQFNTESNYKNYNVPNERNSYVTEQDSAFALKLFSKFFLTKHFSWNLESSFKGLSTIRSVEGTKSLLFFNDIVFTLGILF